ncbi:MAG: hypothetical protein PHX43_05010 [Alphaproteobacteria bacterium]|nr:hypothetical protein [Alphaproteobacteria bacterium]
MLTVEVQNYPFSVVVPPYEWWNVEGYNNVAMPKATLQAVASILGYVDGPYTSGIAAIYPTPDGKLIRIPIAENRTYQYDEATEIPATHPAWSAFRDISRQGRVDIQTNEEGPYGPPANERNIVYLKEIIERDMTAARAYMEAKRLIL